MPPAPLTRRSASSALAAGPRAARPLARRRLASGLVALALLLPGTPGALAAASPALAAAGSAPGIGATAGAAGTLTLPLGRGTARRVTTRTPAVPGAIRPTSRPYLTVGPARGAGTVAGTPRAGTPAGPVPAGGPGSPVAPLAALPGPGSQAGATFLGLTDQANAAYLPDCGTTRPCIEPPDPWVAVSATYVVQSVNGVTRVTTRSGGLPNPGAPTAGVNSNAAWFGLPADMLDADPHVLYDAAHDRWIATLFGYSCTAGRLYVAVSADGAPYPLTSGPGGHWSTIELNFDGSVTGLPAGMPDFPLVGLTSSVVGIGINVFARDPAAVDLCDAVYPPVYGGAQLLAFDLSALEGTGPIPYAYTAPSTTVFSFAPAHDVGAGNRLHVVAAGGGDFANPATIPAAPTVLYGALDGPIGGTTGATSITMTTLDGVTLAQPPPPIDPGGSLDFAADFRITDATWTADRLAFPTTGISGPGGRPRARVVELATNAEGGPAGATLAQVFTLQPSAGFGYTDTFVAGVGYAADGTLWTAYSQSGPSAAISSWSRRQRLVDRPATLPAVDAPFSAGAALLATGRGGYGGMNSRWGDYVGVAPDPAPGMEGTVWQANEFADLAEGWATLASQLGDDTASPSIPGPFSVALGNGRGLPSRTSIPVTVSWGAATDAGSGIGAYRLLRRVNGGAWAAVPLGSPTARSVTVTMAFGASYQFQVSATDNAGNPAGPARTSPAYRPTFYRPIASASVALVGWWGWARCSPCVGGRLRSSSVRNSRVTLTTTAWAIGWVTVRGPARGSARVYRDGVLQGAYSLYARLNLTRFLVTSRTFPTLARHSMRVVVVGTAGHPRIDVDVFIVIR